MNTAKIVKTAIVTFLVLAVIVVGMQHEFGTFGGHDRVVRNLVARNIEARGGAEVWKNTRSLELSGKLDLGQGMIVPYTVRQMRPARMCLAFEFDEQLATQCVDGDAGWKQLPFLGRSAPEPMSDDEVAQMAVSAGIDGLLFDSSARGVEIDYLGTATVDGRETDKLEIRLPGGVTRWLYLDKETALEAKLEWTRPLRGKQQLLETRYSDWAAFGGLMMPQYQETRVSGARKGNFMTIENAVANVALNGADFRMPVLAAGVAQIPPRGQVR